MNDLELYCKNELIPYMTRKTLNTKHSAYGLKHIVEKEIGRYVSQDELQQALLKFGFPVNDFYPISQKYFKKMRNCGWHALQLFSLNGDSYDLHYLG